MKNKFLFSALLMAMSTATFQPFTSLNAAELWNSQSSKNSSEKNTLYNSKNVFKGDSSKRVPIYNSSDRNAKTSKGLASNRIGVSSTLQAYKNLELRDLSPSKQWSLLSPDVQKNRMADVESAIKTEYENKKAFYAFQVKAEKRFKADMKKADKEHANKVADVMEERKAKKQALEDKKMRALGGEVSKSTYASSKSSGSSKKVYASSGSSKKKSGNRTTGVTKPAKVFNSYD